MMTQSAITVILLHILFLLSPFADANHIRYCGLTVLRPLELCVDHNADYEVKVHGVEISPNPLARGQSATFSISASTGNDIVGGKLVIAVAYFGWHVHSESHDLCAETYCPILTGDFVISHSQVLPAFTPPGSYSLKMMIRDANKRQLSCFGFEFSIGFGSSVAAI